MLDFASFLLIKFSNQDITITRIIDTHKSDKKAEENVTTIYFVE
jgi:hypothetical protein